MMPLHWWWDYIDLSHKKTAFLFTEKVCLLDFPLLRVEIDALCVRSDLQPAMPKEGGKGGSCSPCLFSRGAEGARYALLNSINTFRP